MNAQDWMNKLSLKPHLEGGYFKESYRCKETIAAGYLPNRFGQSHCFSTAIYYLLDAPNFSAFHRIKQDELWHFYHGSGLTIHVITESGVYHKLLLGDDPNKDQSFQQYVAAGDWFAASVDDPKGYSLVGCTVSPGFEFADFELADKDELFKTFPQHTKIISQLTR